MSVSDGNERNILDESFRDRGKSNEEKIASLERDVNGRGGISVRCPHLFCRHDRPGKLRNTFNEKRDRLYIYRHE